MHPFEQHLTEPRGRGPVPDGAFVGSAGGLACGDVVRVALRVERRPPRAPSPSTPKVAARHSPPVSACVALAEGNDRARRRPRSARAIAEELGGLSPGKLHAADLAADALHRALADAAAPATPLAARRAGRVLVGLSGGVDSAVAAQLVRAGRATRSSPSRSSSGPTRRATASAAAARRRRCSAPVRSRTRWACRTSRSTWRTLPRPRSSTTSSPSTPRGRTPNPCVRCNGLVRFDAMLALADRARAGALATGHYARIADDGDGPLLARAADPHKDQTYMLAALRPER